MARTDVHRPSVIEPADYEFVAFSYLPSAGDVLGTAMFLADERRRLRDHMERSGGRYSGHEHGGNCHVCGSVNAIYTAVFYHPKSNAYVKTGLDCASKLECGEVEDFRRKVTSALEASKGSRKAKAVLEKEGLDFAWAIYAADIEKRKAFANLCAAWRKANPEPVLVSDRTGYGAVEPGAPRFERSKDEETVVDMVERLIKYGSLTDKALRYLAVLTDRVRRAPEIAAARAAEMADAKPVPVVAGRVTIRGEVLTIREPAAEDFGGPKMLIRHADGWKLWGTVPAAIRGAVARGDEIELVTGIRVSDKDPKFGFLSRPGKARIIKPLAA